MGGSDAGDDEEDAAMAGVTTEKMESEEDSDGGSDQSGLKRKPLPMKMPVAKRPRKSSSDLDQGSPSGTEEENSESSSESEKNSDQDFTPEKKPVARAPRRMPAVGRKKKVRDPESVSPSSPSQEPSAPSVWASPCCLAAEKPPPKPRGRKPKPERVPTSSSSESDSDVDRISEWKRRDEERRRELEEKRKREQEEEIRRLREQEKEEKEKRKEKAEKSEEVHSDSDSSAEDEVAKKGQKGRAKAPSSSDSELELEKEVSAELGTSRQRSATCRDLPLHWGCPCSAGKGCVHRDIHAFHMGALPLPTVEEKLQKLHSEIKFALKVDNPDIKRCLNALEELGTLQVTSHILQKHTDVVATLKKIRRYKANKDVMEKAAEVYTRLKSRVLGPKMEAIQKANKAGAEKDKGEAEKGQEKLAGGEPRSEKGDEEPSAGNAAARLGVAPARSGHGAIQGISNPRGPRAGPAGEDVEES
uniref:Lens epithelium-derived growth factor integrase-binding domain-containing protein n=1 Tax=Melopsittacus undulatus TaxID=13146 RepID=A0A8V5GTQ4_MELUD